METQKYLTYYVRQGTGFVGRVSEETYENIIVFNVATLIGDSVEEIQHMAHGQYGVPYKNMRRG